MRQWIYYGAGCLALIVGVVLFMPFQREAENRVVSAFASLACKETVSTVECMAYYGKGDLTLRQKEEILVQLADDMGLHDRYTLYEEENENGTVRVLAKQTDQYSAAIKLLTVEEESPAHYFYVNLALKDSAESALYYRQQIKKAASRFVEDPQVTVNIMGLIDGKCSDAQKEAIVEQLLEDTGSRLVIDGRDGGLYTVYGYTDQMEDSVTVGGETVNLNIAISYDEQNDQTRIYLAAPILDLDY